MTCVWCGCGDWRTSHASFCPTVDASWLPFLRPGVEYQPECAVTDCARPHKAKGFCGTHYSQWRRGRRDLAAAQIEQTASSSWVDRSFTPPVAAPYRVAATGDVLLVDDTAPVVADEGGIQTCA